MSATAEVATRSWQRGYSIDELREYAELFERNHRAYVFGGFGLANKRDIADALANNEVSELRDVRGRLTACALVHYLRVNSHVQDFVGKQVRISAGCTRVRSIAAESSADAFELLKWMHRRYSGHLWLEAFEEDSIIREALARMPELRYIATKVTSEAEVKGIYTDYAAARSVEYDRADLVALAILQHDFATAAECDAMLAEVDAYAHWEQHYSNSNKGQSWTAFALRGYDAADPQFIIKPSEMSRSWKEASENQRHLHARADWTVAAEHFPKTRVIVDRVLAGRQPDRVRLMRLSAGGELTRHCDIQDEQAGLADNRVARLHVPLRTSMQVLMHAWQKRGEHVAMHWPVGALCYLDQRGPHRVENRDPSCDRIHLVVDLHSDARLRAAVALGTA